MKNTKALAIVERIQSAEPLFENPEITAMAALCELLQELPDDAARLRVMRWSFGRFGGEEFKRPHTAVPQATAARPAPLALVPNAPSAEFSAVDAGESPDFATEVQELNDLFPERSPLRTV